MPRMVHCAKLGKELPGLEAPPMRGELGLRIFTQISETAWRMWLQQSTMIINEYRLNPSEPRGREVLRQHLEEFLFGASAGGPAT